MKERFLIQIRLLHKTLPLVAWGIWELGSYHLKTYLPGDLGPATLAVRRHL